MQSEKCKSNHTEIPSLTPLLSDDKSSQRWWGCGQKEALTDGQRQVKPFPPLQKSVWRVFRNRPPMRPYDSWTPTPTTQSQHSRALTTHQRSVQHSSQEQRNRQKHDNCTRPHVYPALKKDKVTSFSRKWKQPDMIVFHQSSQSRQGKHRVLSLILGS